MPRVAFKMKLFKGFEAEYKRRHDEIWEDLTLLFAQKDVKDFSIFLDEETSDLIACLSIADPEILNELPGEEVQQRWWAYMKDIMETNPDHSPVQKALKEVFYLP